MFSFAMKPLKDHTPQLKVQQNKISFTRVRNAILLDETVGAIPMAVYMAIAYHYPNAFPSQETIARRLKLTRKCVAKYISELELKGYIERKMIGRNYQYYLTNTHEFDASKCERSTHIQQKHGNVVPTTCVRSTHKHGYVVPTNHTKEPYLNNQQSNFYKNEHGGKGKAWECADSDEFKNFKESIKEIFGDVPK